MLLSLCLRTHPFFHHSSFIRRRNNIVSRYCVIDMSTKVYDIHAPPTKENNFFEKSINLIRQVKIMIYIQVFLGINRLFLLKYDAVVIRLSYLYSAFLFSLAFYFMIVADSSESSFIVFKETTIIEYLMLIFITSFTYKETLKNVFEDLSHFDDTLNISEEPAAKMNTKRELFWMVLSLTYCVIEFVIFYSFMDFTFIPSVLIIYVTMLAHDSEQVFFVTLIRSIMIRLRILKAHISKSFDTEKDSEINEEDNPLKSLANNVHLDTTGMHRAYELLHKCAEELNSAMSFSMIVMFFASGLSTTMLLKNFFQEAQRNTTQVEKFNALLIYTAVRCIKYTILVVIPCYYASVTSRQVMNIRTMLHNTIYTFKLEKIERRKIKAFCQLTQDNEFSYALWGVIHLSMSLPLSYASLCTTYLVITIQFSKFID